jgi:hypothetical protein
VDPISPTAVSPPATQAPPVHQAPPVDQASVDRAPGDQAPVRTLGRTSIAWRLAALLLGTVLIVRGSVIGNDVEWPFAPMSQFAFRVGQNDQIRATFLQARTTDGEVKLIAISINNLGLARAEIEGQQPRLIREPNLLADLAASYARLHPGQPELAQLWLNERVTVLRNGRATGEHVQTLVGWPVNDTAPELPQ